MDKKNTGTGNGPISLKTKLKQGMRVKMLKGYAKGQIGTISKFAGDCIQIDLDGAGGWVSAWKDDLELVDPEAAKHPSEFEDPILKSGLLDSRKVEPGSEFRGARGPS